MQLAGWLIGWGDGRRSRSKDGVTLGGRSEANGRKNEEVVHGMHKRSGRWNMWFHGKKGGIYQPPGVGGDDDPVRRGVVGKASCLYVAQGEELYQVQDGE